MLLSSTSLFWSCAGVVHSLRAIQANQLRGVWPHHGEWVCLPCVRQQPGGFQPGALHLQRQRSHSENRWLAPCWFHKLRWKKWLTAPPTSQVWHTSRQRTRITTSRRLPSSRTHWWTALSLRDTTPPSAVPSEAYPRSVRSDSKLTIQSHKTASFGFSGFFFFLSPTSRFTGLMSNLFLYPSA